MSPLSSVSGYGSVCAFKEKCSVVRLLVLERSEPTNNLVSFLLLFQITLKKTDKLLYVLTLVYLTQ